MTAIDRPVVGAVGGSARAAIGSALRAGFECWAVDQFGDRDLRLMAPCATCPPEGYPDSLPQLAAAFPPGPVLYTGGLESHPSVVAHLAERRALWGNGPPVLAKVRDPFWLHDTLEENGLPTPRVRPLSARPSHDARWLRKNPALSGGLGVRFADVPFVESRPGDYLQEYVDGPSLSALYASGRGNTTLLGVTEQLVGEGWLHARGFTYCGNVGPFAPMPGLGARLEAIGAAVGETAGLVGLWGIDLILRGDVPYPVELNPRYTAAVEVLELATGCRSLEWHRRSFEGSMPFRRESFSPVPSPVVGKAVYFAPGCLLFPQAGPWDGDLVRPFDPLRMPAFADIPAPGEAIDAGRPVLTLFAAGPTASACREQLKERAREMDRLLDG